MKRHRTVRTALCTHSVLSLGISCHSIAFPCLFAPSPFHSPSIPLHSPGTLHLDSFLSLLFLCIPLQSPGTLHSLSCISLAFPYISMLFHAFSSHFEPTPICSPGNLLHSFAFYSIHLAIAPNPLRSPGIPLHSPGTLDTPVHSPGFPLHYRAFPWHFVSSLVSLVIPAFPWHFAPTDIRYREITLHSHAFLWHFVLPYIFLAFTSIPLAFCT